MFRRRIVFREGLVVFGQATTNVPGTARNFYEQDACAARIGIKIDKPMRTILLIILILLLIGALPTWPYSTGWGYYPSGGLVLLIVLLLVLLR
jgi:hypothetical protein